MKVLICLCVILAMSAPAMSASGTRQMAVVKNNPAPRPIYDASREVTVSGTVRSVLAGGHPGLPSGAYLTISTSQGVVDAHLGRFALLGSQAVSVRPGQQVEVVGVMTTFKNSSILLVRTIHTDTTNFVVRNEHGALLFPRPADRGQVRFKLVTHGDENQ
jgi:hypothetical protein